LGRCLGLNSSMVIASASACNGCPVALSMLIIGTVAYFIKLDSTISALSFLYQPIQQMLL
jgi:hypothetical protein